MVIHALPVVTSGNHFVVMSGYGWYLLVMGVTMKVVMSGYSGGYEVVMGGYSGYGWL